jgi:hypothetical protein
VAFWRPLAGLAAFGVREVVVIGGLPGPDSAPDIGDAPVQTIIELQAWPV